jgi:hypothetical protein
LRSLVRADVGRSVGFRDQTPGANHRATLLT